LLEKISSKKKIHSQRKSQERKRLRFWAVYFNKGGVQKNHEASSTNSRIPIG
jgi:hypothetical protein